MPSLSDLGAALFSCLAIAVPIVLSLYVGTKLAERRIDALLCCLIGFSVLVAGWAIALPKAFALENVRCPVEHGCAQQGVRSD